MEGEPTKKHVYVTCIVNMYKILLLRGYDIGEKIDILDKRMPLDDKAIAIWKSTSAADFVELRDIYEYDQNSANDFEFGDNGLYYPKQSRQYPYRNLVRYDVIPRNIATIFIGENGSEPSKGLVETIRDEYADTDTDVILITKGKLPSEASNIVRDMMKEPTLPKVWHFLYSDIIKFAPENIMCPRMILYKDREVILNMISRYTSSYPDEKGVITGNPDPKRAPIMLFDDHISKIYGASIGDLMFIVRPTKDPNAISTKITQLRIVSADKITDKYKR